MMSMRCGSYSRPVSSSMMLTFTPFGVGSEKSCSRSGYSAGQRAKIAWLSVTFLFLKSFANAKASDLAIRYREHSASGLQGGGGEACRRSRPVAFVREVLGGSVPGAALLAMHEYRFEPACTSTATNISSVQCHVRRRRFSRKYASRGRLFLSGSDQIVRPGRRDSSSSTLMP